MISPAFDTTFHFSLLDLRRSRWLPLLLTIVAVASGAGVFSGQLGLMEQQRIAVAIAAPVARILAVLVVTVLIIATMSREASDRSRQLALAAAISRPGWILARWCSFVVMAIATAAACGLPMVLLAPDGLSVAALAWTLSLAFELCIVASIAMTISLAITHVAAATLASLAVYCASRLIGVILLLSSRNPLVGAERADGIADLPFQILGALLPRLDLFARTGWLTGEAITAAGVQVGQTAVYCALMLVVAMWDFGRQDL